MKNYGLNCNLTSIPTSKHLLECNAWIYFNYTNESEASRHLTYIRSVIPALHLNELSKAYVRKEKDHYHFQLTEIQYKAYCDALDNLWQDKAKSAPLAVAKVPAPVAPVASSKKYSSLDSVMRDAIISKDDPTGQWIFLCFNNQKSADACFREIKNVLSSDFNTSSWGVRHTPIHQQSPYRFRLTKEQYEALKKKYRTLSPFANPAEVLGDDYFVKSLRADEYDFFDDFQIYLYAF